MAVLAGLAGALVELRARSADHDARDELLTTAVAIARSISAERFSALSFTTDDELLPEYQRIAREMAAYGAYLGQETIYSVAQRDGHLVFGPEGIERGSPLASRPGTVYEQADPRVAELFTSARPVVFGALHRRVRHVRVGVRAGHRLPHGPGRRGGRVRPARGEVASPTGGHAE